MRSRAGRIGLAGMALFGCLAGVLPFVGRAEPVAPQAPDIIFILIDTLRADRVGAFGNRRGLTPFLDSLAARGVVLPLRDRRGQARDHLLTQPLSRSTAWCRHFASCRRPDTLPRRFGGSGRHRLRRGCSDVLEFGWRRARPLRGPPRGERHRAACRAGDRRTGRSRMARRTNRVREPPATSCISTTWAA